MDDKRFFVWSSMLSGAGVLFAGYLTGTRLVTGSCPFNEPCPYFLGYPACWYGLGLFIIMFAISVVGLLGFCEQRTKILAIRFVAGLGTLFSGSFVIQELILALRYGAPAYGLLLPTCAYGLIVYCALFTLSHKQLRRTSVVSDGGLTKQ